MAGRLLRREHLRVLFVSPDYPPDVVGGIGPYTAEVAPQLADRGHEVHVLCCRQGEHNEDETHGAVTVHRRGWRDTPGRGLITRAPEATLRWRNALETRRHIRSLGHFDAIEVPDWKAFGAFLPRGIPLVLHLHMPLRVHAEYEPEFTDWDVTCSDLIERRAVPKALVVTCPSNLLADRVRNGPWKIGTDIRIVRHAISPLPWQQAGPVATTPPTVLFVGRLEPRKAPDLLIEGAAKLLERVPDLNVVFAGAETNTAKGLEFARSLRVSSERLGVPCTFAGKQSREELVGWHARARLAVIPSRFDNFPMTGLEALAAGRPLVVSDQVGLAEIIGDAGAVFPSGDPDALAAAMLPYLLDPVAAGRAGARAQVLARDNFSPQKIAAGRERCFAEAAALVSSPT
ncbi:MAG TPA: glycosyltransferase family 4 protein [Actinomycetota bacterium]|nr:glycosyltransferase family 4 protein [Actinomycetota bacterium]